MLTVCGSCTLWRGCLDSRLHAAPAERVRWRGCRERSTIIVPSAGLPWFRELFNYYAGGTNETGCVRVAARRCGARRGAAGTSLMHMGRRRSLVGKEFPIEAKVFFFELGENPRGRFLRISESGAG